jgi:nucleoid DNA-binding protein
MINRKEIARRIALSGGYNIGDVDDILALYEDVVTSAIKNREEVKHGKLYKIVLQRFPEKIAWNGLQKVSFVRPAKDVPKLKPLIRLSSIQFLADEEKDK